MSADPNRAGMTRDERAGDWCVRLAGASLSPGEQAEFDAWIAEDPANVASFDKALDVWNTLHAIGDSPEIIGQRADALQALRRSNRRRWSRGLAGRFQWPLAIAASLALFLAVGLFLHADRPDMYRTATGERRTFVLADGSRLSLDAASQVSVDYEDDRRQLVLLAGRAKFDVAKDRTRPFTVTAGNRTVVATGTAFTVEMLAEKVHVIVYEGHVAVVPDKDPAVAELRRIVDRTVPVAASLSPGKELVAALDRPGGEIVQADVARSLAWEGGQLNFVDEPLSAAVERFNRYEQGKLIVGDDRAGRILVNGVFNAGDSEAFVEALSAAFPVRAQRQGGSIVLSSRGG